MLKGIIFFFLQYSGPMKAEKYAPKAPHNLLKPSLLLTHYSGNNFKSRKAQPFSNPVLSTCRCARLEICWGHCSGTSNQITKDRRKSRQENKELLIQQKIQKYIESIKVEKQNKGTMMKCRRQQLEINRQGIQKERTRRGVVEGESQSSLNGEQTSRKLASVLCLLNVWFYIFFCPDTCARRCR